MMSFDDRPHQVRPVVYRVARRSHLRIVAPPIEPDPDRPKTRGDCIDGPRPCPWVSCRHHLYLDVKAKTGSIKLNRPDLEPDELQHSCSLDIADEGGTSLQAIARMLNVTRERARQIEDEGAKKLAALLDGWKDEDDE